MSKYILVIDDDEGIRDGLTALLQDEGYHVTAVENGKKALDILASGPFPAVIILDLMMPVMDGAQFCAERSKCPRISSIPVILLTASSLSNQTMTLPVSHWLRKPIEIENFLNLVQRESAA
jgi:CheY-like chemotaxis protein